MMTEEEKPPEPSPDEDQPEPPVKEPPTEEPPVEEPPARQCGARLRNDATALRNRQEFQRSQVSELASMGFESWAKESFEIATKFAYRNGGRIGTPKGGKHRLHDVRSGSGASCGVRCQCEPDCRYKDILGGYRLANLLMRVTQNFD